MMRRPTSEIQCDHVMRSFVRVLLLVLALPGVTRADPPPIVASPRESWRFDGVLIGSGLTALAVSAGLATDSQPVPLEGLPSSNVHLGFDREAIGEKSADAGLASDRLESLSLAYPVLLRAGFSHGTDRLRSPLNAAVMTLESVVIAQGVGAIMKPLVSRPRPYTYLSDAERPSGAEYDVASDRAFHSFPSGHSTAAWAAVSTGICDHLLSRPTAGWGEHATVGFLGGMLAATTAALRVEAGQHFPSDVFAGSVIGIASGTTVPLLHRYVSGGAKAPLPTRRSLLGAIGGTAVGVGAGLFAAEILGDWN